MGQVQALRQAVVVAGYLLFLAGCPLEPFSSLSRDRDTLVILSYNCENLFDDVDQGSEYPEYDPSAGKWSSEAYLGKLAALAAAIRSSGREPDLLLLQEVENRTCLKRLCDDFLPLGGYDFVAAPLAEGAAIQTAVASRIPVVDLKVHRAGGSAGERNILEIRLAPGGEEIVLFNNHWKSRRGGTEETEGERIRSALLLRRRIDELASREPELPVLAAGDFNEDPWESGADYPRALLAEELAAAAAPVLKITALPEPQDAAACLISSWPGIPGGGSYYYGGRWQRIDNFFWTSSLSDGSGWEVDEFFLVDDPKLLSNEGLPLRYSPTSFTGYSDHLPLGLVLRKH